MSNLKFWSSPVELPHSDSGAIKKGWELRFFNDNSWLSFAFELDVMTHSKNWSMGTVNIDIFCLNIVISKWELFLSYRFEVFPPKEVSIMSPSKEALDILLEHYQTRKPDGIQISTT